MSIVNFTTGDDNDDELQVFLDGLNCLSPVTPGKRGGGRKATNNIGADTLGVDMLNALRNEFHVSLSKPGNLKGNTLWGVIDQKSYDRANQLARGIDPSYSQVGILAISLAPLPETSTFGKAFVQWWKGTIVNDVLTFKKVFFKGMNYVLDYDPSKKLGLWKVDSATGKPILRSDGKTYFSFPLHTLVDFEAYLNTIVEVAEVPVSFPENEVAKLRGLSEILANVNVASNEVATEIPTIEMSEEDFEEEEEE